MDQTPQPGQRRRKKQTALIRRQDRESNSSGGDHPKDVDPHVSLPRNIPSIALTPSSILCPFFFLFFLKIHFAEVQPPKVRDAAPWQSSLVLPTPGGNHFGPNGVTGRQEMGSASPAHPRGTAPITPLLGAWGRGSPSPTLRRICSPRFC